MNFSTRAQNVMTFKSDMTNVVLSMLLRCSEAAFVAFSLAQNCHSGGHFISWRMWHSETPKGVTLQLYSLFKGHTISGYQN